MRNKNIPLNTELPTKGRLIKSTIIATCMAAIILVTIVLPAEYGIDPTGVGGFIGLLKMGEIKVSLAQEAADDRANAKPQQSGRRGNAAQAPESIPTVPATESKAGDRSDEMTISLAPNEGKEIKLMMLKGAKVNFDWWTNGGKANFDAHADSKPLNIKYHSYEKGSLVRNQGVLKAAFAGNHGWFWRNRTSETMTVTLKVSGSYTEIKQF